MGFNVKYIELVCILANLRMRLDCDSSAKPRRIVGRLMERPDYFVG